MSKERALTRSHALVLILAVLGDGERHGYDIAREVERRSENQISFNDGTLYPLLHVLEEQEYIASRWEKPSGERQRRVYRLLPAGNAELADQLSKWRAYSNAVNAVLGGETLKPSSAS